MEIVDIAEEYRETYCNCLEDWSDEMKEAGSLKSRWYDRNRDQGLRVKLARDEQGRIVGMIHYAPIERAPAIGEGLYYVYCIWVHGHKKGVGDHRRRGIGKALLDAAERDAKALGGKGLAAWGITLPFFMRSKWFKKNGYSVADRDGMVELVWKSFAADAIPPKLLKPMKKPESGTDRPKVTCFRNGWCQAQNIACERMKRAAGELGGAVDIVEIDTDRRDVMDDWGYGDAIFVDGRQVVTGPPPTLDKLRRILKKAVAQRLRHG